MKSKIEKPNTRIEVANLEVARKLIDLTNCGLSDGIGEPIPGQMCVEAAVCYALGMEHGDDPPCVHEEVRNVKISLNDSSAWKSDKARGKGLQRIAIAQLNSVSEYFDYDVYRDTLDRELIRSGIISKIVQEDLKHDAIAFIEDDVEGRKIKKKLMKYTNKKNFRNFLNDIEFLQGALDNDPFILLDLDSYACLAQSDLITIADCIEEALRKAKSPGVKLLDKLLPRKKNK